LVFIATKGPDGVIVGPAYSVGRGCRVGILILGAGVAVLPVNSGVTVPNPAKGEAVAEVVGICANEGCKDVNAISARAITALQNTVSSIPNRFSFIANSLNHEYAINRKSVLALATV